MTTAAAGGGRRDRKSPHEASGILPLVAGFSAILLVFVIVNATATVRIEELRRARDVIVGNMLASVTLVARMAHDLDEKRNLLNNHIVETTAPGMARVERQIAAVDEDFRAAKAAYDPLATLPEEHETWERLQGHVSALEPLIDQTLALSRRNLNAQARAQLMGLMERFTEIDSETAALIRINNDGAAEQSRVVSERMRSLRSTLLGLTVVGALFTLLIAAAALRIVGQRENLRQRYTELLELRNHDLDSFAGRVAHDLRGPLTTIDASASVLAMHMPGNGHVTTRIHRSVERMNDLINDLLTLSRIDAMTRSQTGDPVRAIDQVRDDLVARVGEAHGRLRIFTEPSVVRCGSGFLQQLLLNLVDNAVKYCRDDVSPEVEIRGRNVNDYYELRISDNGVGMSQENISHLFEPFYRAPEVLERPGTGLGLAIVKRIVDASGGTVSVVSAVGSGTTFVVRLPVVRSVHAETGMHA